MNSWKAYMLSHLVVFGAGLYVGKAIDADELEGYRRIHDDAASKWRRRLWMIGGLVGGTTALSWYISLLRQRYRQSIDM
jgi:hypothetical protein